VEGSADEHKLHIELLSRLAPHLICPEETRDAKWLINTGVLNSRSNPVASRVILVSGTPAAHMLKLGRRSWHRNKMVLGRRTENVGGIVNRLRDCPAHSTDY